MTGVRTEEVTYCRVTWARARPRRDGAAAARILGRFHGSHYYDWAYTNSRFGFFQRPVNIKREGKWCRTPLESVWSAGQIAGRRV